MSYEYEFGMNLEYGLGYTYFSEAFDSWFDFGKKQVKSVNQ